MALAAKDAAANFWLERNLIVLAAMVAHDLKPLRSVRRQRGLFPATLWAPLRRHHIPLIKKVLFLFGKRKGVLALNASCFNVRHCDPPLELSYCRHLNTSWRKIDKL